MAASRGGPLTDVSRAVEVQSVFGQACVEPDLTQSQVDLIEVDLAIGDRQGAVHERGSECALELDVRVQAAGGPVDVRNVQRHDAQIARMRMKLTVHRHAHPLLRSALRRERALDRADRAGVESDLRADRRTRGAHSDEPGAQSRVLDLAGR